MGKEQDIELIKKYQKEIFLFSQAYALLHWDLETYMPKKGAECRAEQMALLESLSHEKLISDELWEALERLKEEDLSEDDDIMVKRLYKDCEKARKIPKELIEELARATSLGTIAWRQAREEKDFKIFEPHLKKIIKLKRKEAECINLPGYLYNSLLDKYEEGMTVEELRLRFEGLKKGIIALLQKIKDSGRYKTQKVILKKKEFPEPYQMELVRDVAQKIGLGKDFSRIDFSEHPFTTSIGSGDVRFTTNIREDPLFSFYSSMHEAGHALYEAGLPKEHFLTVLYDAPSLGMHESQSRFWENMIGKGQAFWKYYFERFNRRFGIDDFDKWYREVNIVEPSMIRIESDEVHYPLHIILRFEIELGLLEGTIQVEELPKIWNKKMREYFGIEPQNDKQGVLQDVHWSQGSIGYFPTYILGSIYAAQLYEALKKEYPNIEKDIEKGDFMRIQQWLKENIHKHGRKYLADEIIKNTCGEGLNPDAYLDYLRKKYSKIYAF